MTLRHTFSIELEYECPPDHRDTCYHCGFWAESPTGARVGAAQVLLGHCGIFDAQTVATHGLGCFVFKRAGTIV